MTGRSETSLSGGGSSANLADILERVLDKGIVIAGDIRVDLLDIELLTIKLRLVVASVDKAREMGIDWWESDPSLSSGARRRAMDAENARLRSRIAELEAHDGREAHDGLEELEGPERRSSGEP
ncbi:gas vesicle protein [Streptomyces rectiverticillatus]|uniref:gas vesicle protein n=1 Tax=Streptomyces rectiverticillatus TaxID=173860 RepID=UPI0015C3B864|nr:gas vesicle protein [Streptomyces rectiverticillatus]QLE70607.1 gas vesicle protein [Streptomyces rectiverticillatus]